MPAKRDNPTCNTFGRESRKLPTSSQNPGIFLLLFRTKPTIVENPWQSDSILRCCCILIKLVSEFKKKSPRKWLKIMHEPRYTKNYVNSLWSVFSFVSCNTNFDMPQNHDINLIPVFYFTPIAVLVKCPFSQGVFFCFFASLTKRPAKDFINVTLA